MTAGQRIEVKASRPYPVCLDVRLEEFGDYLRQKVRPGSHLLVFSQEGIANLYYSRLLAGLSGFQVDLLTFPAGESEKSLSRLEELTTRAVRLGADRNSIAIALGGGVVGDLAGFFAAVYMRGIRFFQLPTTLLAQVDSSIGGKVAVNHPTGKNLLGAFYPPGAVWTDFSTLESLPWAEVQNGLAETIKHAILGDEELFLYLETHAEQICKRDKAIWREMICRSAAVKIRIVSEDEKEQEVRALLNLGHSFGHALETELGYAGISHGQGVAIGINAAAVLANQRGYLGDTDVFRIVSLLKAFGLPVEKAGVNRESLLQRMEADKKNKEGRKVLVLPVGIGQAAVFQDCSDAEILQAWSKVIRGII